MVNKTVMVLLMKLNSVKKTVKQIENFVITTWDKTYEGNTLVTIIKKLLIKILSLQGTGKDSPRW